MAAPPFPPLESTVAVLDRVRELRAISDAVEAELVVRAADWAAMHSAESVPDLGLFEDFADRPLSVAGPGAPEVAEFSVAEFALASDKSTDAGRRDLGEAIEIRHRLPFLFREMLEGRVPAWRARRIARATLSLPMSGARFVDVQIAKVAHKVGVVVLDRLVEEARVRFDPEEAELRAAAAAESRHATAHYDPALSAGVEGIGYFEAALDLPDLRDLDEAISSGAARLAADGSPDPLDVRRAKALGLLARGELANGDGSGPAKRRISLHLHASDDPTSPLVRVEETRSFVLIDRLAEWCLDPATQLDVHPVIDLAEHVHVESYEVSDRLATHTRLLHVTCGFPRCHRPAKGCDHDHVIPHDKDGPTCTCNIAPLCRGHHRLKTHGGWSYEYVGPGTYIWTSPHGLRYRRDPTGTSTVPP